MRIVFTSEGGNFYLLEWLICEQMPDERGIGRRRKVEGRRLGKRRTVTHPI